MTSVGSQPQIFRTKLLWAALLLPLPVFSADLSPERIFEGAAPSIWSVITQDANGKNLRQGSAVVIAPGKLITNCHVLSQARSVLIRKDKVTHQARLEFPDPKRDLCQLDAPTLEAPAVTIGKSREARVGQRVYAIGSPRGLELSMSEGIVSSLRSANEQDSPLIQTTAPVSPGSSGGGLFNSTGALIGITTFGVRDSQNLNFAHPVEWIAEIPDRAKSQLELHQSANVATAPGAPSKVPGKVLASQELNFLPRNRQGFKVENAPATLSKITFKSNGYVDLEFSNAYVNLMVGQYKIESGSSKICFSFTPGFYAPLIYLAMQFTDCYQVTQISENRFEFHSANNSSFTIFN